MYLISVIVRAAWSVTIGIPFFVLGLAMFLIADILMPRSDTGYRMLNRMFKWGSLGSFKGLRMEQDQFDPVVTKQRPPKQPVS